jgi:hypothetical protein
MYVRAGNGAGVAAAQKAAEEVTSLAPLLHLCCTSVAPLLHLYIWGSRRSNGRRGGDLCCTSVAPLLHPYIECVSYVLGSVAPLLHLCWTPGAPLLTSICIVQR